MRCEEKKNLQRGRKIRGGGGSLEQSWDGIRPGVQGHPERSAIFSDGTNPLNLWLMTQIPRLGRHAERTDRARTEAMGRPSRIKGVGDLSLGFCCGCDEEKFCNFRKAMFIQVSSLGVRNIKRKASFSRNIRKINDLHKCPSSLAVEVIVQSLVVSWKESHVTLMAVAYVSYHTTVNSSALP